MALLKKLSIKLQILSISGLALLGFFSICAVYLISNTLQNNLQHRQNEAQHIFELEEELHFEILKVWRRDNDYIIRLNDKYIEHRAAIIEYQKSLLVELKTSVQTENELKFIYDLGNLASKYQTQFAQVSKDRITIGLDEKSGLRGDLRQAAQQAEEKLTLLKAIELTTMMLIIRRHEKDFLLRLDKKYIGLFYQQVSDLKSAILVSDFPAKTQNDFLILIEKYKVAFHNLSDVRLTLIPKETALSIIYEKSQLSLDSLHEKVQQNFHRSLLDTESNAISTRYVISALFILTAIFVVSAGIWISTIISRPIQGIATAMERLANGKMETHIPGASYKNEIGKISKSLSFFRDQQVENEQLIAKQLSDKFRQIEHAENLRNLIVGFENKISMVLGQPDSTVKTMSEPPPGLPYGRNHKKEQSGASSAQATEHVQTVVSAFAEHSASITEIKQQVERSSAITRKAAQKAVNKKHSGQVIQLYDKDR